VADGLPAIGTRTAIAPGPPVEIEPACFPPEIRAPAVATSPVGTYAALRRAPSRSGGRDFHEGHESSLPTPPGRR